MVDDKDAFRKALADTGIQPLAGPFLDFLDPWGNRIEIVSYENVQFTKAPNVLRGMGPVAELHTTAGKVFASFYARVATDPDVASNEAAANERTVPKRAPKLAEARLSRDALALACLAGAGDHIVATVPLIGCSAMDTKTGHSARTDAPAVEKRRERPSSRPTRCV